MKQDTGLFEDILNTLSMGVFVLDAAGNYLYVNDAYCSMVSKTPEFFAGMSIAKLKDLGFITYNAFEEVTQKEATVVTLVKVTDSKLNQVYQLFSTTTPIFNPDGSIKYIFYMVETMKWLIQRIQDCMLNQRHSTDTTVSSKALEIDIIAESEAMKEILLMLSNVSETDASILITGPTGAGKEVVAQYAHKTSRHGSGPFISVDCASIPENLLESELFGYEKGAFSGASPQGKQGLIEAADGGTLFLDEINSLPPGLQGKLLRVLETRHVKRLGAVESKPISFRLVCASNESLSTLVREGNFRSDLYYRINVVPVEIPALKDRRDDIVPLTLFYLHFFCTKYSRMKVLSPEMIDTIQAYPWPGNVRQLKNFMERLVVTSPETDIQLGAPLHSLLPPEPGFAGLSGASATADAFAMPGSEAVAISSAAALSGLVRQDSNHALSGSDSNPDMSHREYMDMFEKQLLLEMLKKHKTPADTARVLKLDLSNVYRKMKKYGISAKTIFESEL